MYRGTTPTLQLTITGLSELTLSQVWVTLENTETHTEINKQMSDLLIESDKITVALTQTDTLALQSGYVEVQARLLDSAGKAYATQVQGFYLQEILKDGQITAPQVQNNA